MKKLLTIFLCFSSLSSFADQWWGEKETNSLMVAYQLLDDQWIQDVGALTSDWARVYYSSLKEDPPPAYGVYIPNADNTSLTYSTMSQKDLWDYLYNTPASNGVNNFRYYIQNDNDGLGDYIKLPMLLPEFHGVLYNENGKVAQTPLDASLLSVSKRLACLNTMQTTRELQTMSNAVCNCDWEIVSNIYTVVNSALYSSWQGQNWSVADWTRFIWNYLTTNNSGKPIKELLNDISSYTSSSSDNISNIWSWLQDNQGSFTNGFDYAAITNNLFQVLGFSYVPSNIRSYLQTLLISNEDILNWVDYDFTITDFLNSWNDSSNTLATRNDWLNRFTETTLFDAYLNFLSIGYQYPLLNDYKSYIANTHTNTIPLRFAWENLTNKTTSVAYTLVEPSVGRDIYGTLTNAYITSGSMNASDWNWFDRVEMLLAALVFPETTSSNGVADADSAQSSAESQSDQFKDVLTSIQSTAFGSAKQQTQTTANTFTGFFTTLNSALTLNPPEALIIPVPNTPTDLDQSAGDLAWTVDFSSGGAKVALEFCRALSSFIVIVGFLFVVWKIGLLTFHVTLTISSLCFKTVQRILGK